MTLFMIPLLSRSRADTVLNLPAKTLETSRNAGASRNVSNARSHRM